MVVLKEEGNHELRNVTFNAIFQQGWHFTLCTDIRADDKIMDFRTAN